MASLPWLHTLDDHEIANDWSLGNETEPFPSASDPFIHYHVSVNPPIPPSSPKSSNTTYFQFNRGPAQFFMLDTRRYRTDPEPLSNTRLSTHNPLQGVAPSLYKSNPPPPQSNHTMLGPEQLSSLLTFLSTPPAPGVHWKIIASSVPFTKNWRFGTSDTWGGFPTERATVLRAMHAAERNLGVRVVVLSGDRHEFAAIRFPPVVASGGEASTPSLTGTDRQVIYDRTPQSGPHEFSVGPLSMFYLPFRTFRQVDGEDVKIKYMPDGNSKVGVVEINNFASAAAARRSGGMKRADGGGDVGQRSVLKYTLWVDGEVAWEYVLTSPGPGFGKGKKSAGGFGLWN